jgi:photosystem II stability/assembly factor-like uncharacterized protein
MTGAYLTEDGGASWRMFNLGSTVRFFAFDESDPQVVYAETTRLWRSVDGGRTWRPVYPSDARLVIDGDHAEERVESSQPPVDALWAKGPVLWAAMGNALRRSSDGGASWSQAGSISGRARRIYSVAESVYLLGPDFVAIRDASGAIRSFSHNRFSDIAMGFEDGRPMFYGGSKDGLFVSHDGEHWDKTSLTGDVRAVASCLQHGKVAYASYQNDSFGVAHTGDGGQTWDLGWKESRTKAPNVDDGWISQAFGPGWPEQPLALAVSPSDPNRAWATDMGRTLYTNDGGKTWPAAYTRKLKDGSFASTGLDVTTNYGVHFDPFDSRHVFISYTDIGLFVSGDGGVGWRSATVNGVPHAWRNTTYWLEFDPDVRGRMWAAMSGTHDLPRPKMWRRVSTERFRGGICRSDDGGQTWQVSSTGMPETAPTHILLDRRSTADARVLYVAAFGRGVFRSDDGGRTWIPKNGGLPKNEPFAWRLAQDRAGVLYVVIARRSDDGSIGNDLDGSLYKSGDRGESWHKIALPDDVNGPNGLAVDPEDPKRLYLAAWARSGHKNGGIFLSTDAGTSWQRVHDADQHVYDVTIDSRNASVLYAAGFESSAWRSADRGESWARVPGYDFKWGHRVIPDPSDRRLIYVTTFGGSVWHGPAE